MQSQSVCIFAIVIFVCAVHCACVCVLYSTLHKIKIMKWKRNTNHTNSLIMAKMQICSFFSQIFIVVDKSEETSSKNKFCFIHFLWVSISWPSFVELIVENHKQNYLTSCEWVIFVSINWIEGNHKVAKWNEFDCILVELIKGKSGKDNEFNERKHRKKYSLKLYNLGVFFYSRIIEWMVEKWVFLFAFGIEEKTRTIGLMEFLCSANWWDFLLIRFMCIIISLKKEKKT